MRKKQLCSAAALAFVTLAALMLGGCDEPPEQTVTEVTRGFGYVASGAQVYLPQQGNADTLNGQVRFLGMESTMSSTAQIGEVVNGRLSLALPLDMPKETLRQFFAQKIPGAPGSQSGKFGTAPAEPVLKPPERRVFWAYGFELYDDDKPTGMVVYNQNNDTVTFFYTEGPLTVDAELYIGGMLNDSPWCHFEVVSGWNYIATGKSSCTLTSQPMGGKWMFIPYEEEEDEIPEPPIVSVSDMLIYNRDGSFADSNLAGTVRFMLSKQLANNPPSAPIGEISQGKLSFSLPPAVDKSALEPIGQSLQGYIDPVSVNVFWAQAFNIYDDEDNYVGRVAYHDQQGSRIISLLYSDGDVIVENAIDPLQGTSFSITAMSGWNWLFLEENRVSNGYLSETARWIFEPAEQPE